MTIAIVWYWNRATEIFPNWRDGLRAAIEIISKITKLIGLWMRKFHLLKDMISFILGRCELSVLQCD